MAIENKVLLNGQIERLQRITGDDGIPVQITVRLKVMRRSSLQGKEPKRDTVKVVVRDKNMLDYLIEHRAENGDMMETQGVYCTVPCNKIFYCGNEGCGAENSFQGSDTFVHPLFLRTWKLHPESVETILLSDEERRGSREKINQLLYERKQAEGDIVETKDLGKQKDGMYHIQATIRKRTTRSDVSDWFYNMQEISNRIYIMGNLCANPVYDPAGNGGRVCSYQIGTNRKVFVKQDSPENRADFPWVKSLGEQAEKDRDALVEGSLVFIDGSIQARDGFTVKRKCCKCGEICEVKDETMEIVPFRVKYLRNCILPESRPEDEEEAE